MRLRPCIDIHNGMVKQIIGSSLRDEGNAASENYVSEKGASFYAKLYREKNLPGGHIIILNKAGTPEYEASLKEALSALKAYPDGMQAGGGINDENACVFLDAGASHVIVTSFVFKDGHFDEAALHAMQKAVGKERLVLDLSCRKRDGKYYVATDRWQSFTDFEVTAESLRWLSAECDEFLIHGVDSEGKKAGIEKDLLRILSRLDGIPVTYAGGIGSLGDIELLGSLGNGKVDFTAGSSLSLFGGELELDDILKYIETEKQPLCSA